jgi:hypothetical protein
MVTDHRAARAAAQGPDQSFDFCAQLGVLHASTVATLSTCAQRFTRT